MTLEEYIARYSQRHRVYWGGGIPWRKYKGVLRPLSHPSLEPNWRKGETTRLLADSKAAFATWTYNFDTTESEWWWIVAERPYGLDLLKPKTRYNIRHGAKTCTAKLISGTTLADLGYPCYKAAMQRHSQTVLLGEEAFRRAMPTYDFDEAHEIWGIFADGKMIGYAIYMVIDDTVYEEDTIFDPAYFKYHSPYVLIHTTTEHYLNERNFRHILCGWRSISHETRFQEFTIDKFRRRKAYCRLGLEYAGMYGILARIVFYSKGLWSRLALPEALRHKLHVVYTLNRIKNACAERDAFAHLSKPASSRTS